MILYRGSLKSCNYHCSYCPFSKHAKSVKELDKDKEQWYFFVQNLLMAAHKKKTHAFMLTPYGEALIYPWYWEGLSKISSLFWIEAAGAQTNLSFSVEKCLDIYLNNGGKIDKLRLWATFHPEMTTVEQFVQKCRQLAAAGVKICAGAVGNPQNIKTLQQLRNELPEEIYLWMNRMDGMQRAYNAQEIQAFSNIDPYFYRELLPHPADVSQCRDRIFVKGDGTIQICNISAAVKEDKKNRFCRRKNCSCYLAYGGRRHLVNEMLFGPWPLFRIPRRPKAVFLDIEGTLQSSGSISQELMQTLEVLSKKEKTVLFFATTLPYIEAKKRCRIIWHLFSGGVFAGGAHVLCKRQKSGPDENKGRGNEYYEVLEEAFVRYFKPLEKQFRFRMLAYRSESGACCKITLLHAHKKPWSGEEAEKIFAYLPKEMKMQARYLLEGHCMQIVAARAQKAAGVKMICAWLQIPYTQVFAAGDAKEDEEMMRLCGGSRQRLELFC